jgi:hypothetical protein
MTNGMGNDKSVGRKVHVKALSKCELARRRWARLTFCRQNSDGPHEQ